MRKKKRIKWLEEESERMLLYIDECNSHRTDEIKALSRIINKRTQFEWGTTKHVNPNYLFVTKDNMLIDVPIKRDIAPMMKLLLEKLNFIITDIEADTKITEAE